MSLRISVFISSLLLCLGMIHSSALADNGNAPRRVKIGQHSSAAQVNINTASAKELETLKYIGKERALQIVKDREARGPFTSADDLTRIKGIGRGTVNKNRHRITVGSSTPKSEANQPDSSAQKKPREAKPVRRNARSQRGKKSKKPRHKSFISVDGKRIKTGPKAATGKININTADAKALSALKYVGKKRADHIVKDRQKNGPFKTPYDLTRIKGIGKKTVDKNLHLITVGEISGQTQVKK